MLDEPAPRDGASPAQPPRVTDADLARAVSGVGLTAVFQPIVSLADESIVGFEALSRWLMFDEPHAELVFEYAARNDRLEELDHLCIQSTIDAAAHAALPEDVLLLINCEPASAFFAGRADTPAGGGRHRRQLVFEVTERELLTHTDALLRKVAAIRSAGFAVALDDVGARPSLSSALDVVGPDLVKLDMSIVRAQSRDEIAHIMTAVSAYQQRSGAVILAEGIENAQHREQATAAGATLGQGYLFGKPGPLSRPFPPPWTLQRRRQVTDVDGTPFEVVSGSTEVRVTRKPTLVALSRRIEEYALRAAEFPIVLSAMQHGRHYTSATRARYAGLATSSALVVVYGRDMPADVGAGVRAVQLNPSDPLSRDWMVLTLGPLSAAALVARDRTGPDDVEVAESERLFDFAVTYDRDMVAALARHLLRRMD
ncbi:sensor domain-containing phosphodiesterase [Mycobacterium sp. Marseille-P9652]|uniref:sensor domain-containing phosphodiesterase n=1 Tax=Mycobacterium sp. Marseille-P9652 TaxID=2654950 RepID=UPI0012E789E1|nr:EAL domain-containing protein [Mycobacterium sp. Marseille-P9652]